jgi:crossover junction endodeoxyribonuclease RuvC
LLTLGIDPGTAIMGYGLVASDGRSLQAIDYGAVTTSSALPPEERLRRLHERLCAIIAAHHPDAMAVEELFFNANARTAMAVGQARGVALLAAAQAGLRVHEYTPLQVKDAVAGYGRAGKEQVQLMAATLLALRAVPRPDDAADALAVAICHAHSARLAGLVGP